MLSALSTIYLFGIVTIQKHFSLNKWGFGNDSILGKKTQQLEKFHRWGNVKRVRGEKKAVSPKLKMHTFGNKFGLI